jgi:uncharacterized protein YggE
MAHRLRIALAAAAALFGAVNSGAQATMQSDTSRMLIMASGSTRQSVTPDRATLVLWIDAQGMSVQEAGSRLATAQRAVLDTLRRMNLPASAIQSYDNGVTPFRSSNMPPGMMSGPAFSGRSVVRVELPRTDLVSAVSAAALAKGATFVAPPMFTAGAADSVRYALIPRAFEQARRAAESLARAAGGHLGRLVDLNAPQGPIIGEQNSIFVNSYSYDNGPRAIPNSTVVATVSARWLFVPDAR